MLECVLGARRIFFSGRCRCKKAVQMFSHAAAQYAAYIAREQSAYNQRTYAPDTRAPPLSPPPVIAQARSQGLFLVATRSGSGVFTLAIENRDSSILSARSSDVQLRILSDQAYEAKADVGYLVFKCAPFTWPTAAVSVIGIGSAVCERCDALGEANGAWAREDDTTRVLRIGGVGVVYIAKSYRAEISLTPDEKRVVSSGGCTIILRTFETTTQKMEIMIFSSANQLVLRSELNCASIGRSFPCALVAPFLPKNLFRTRRILIEVPKGAVRVSDLAVIAFPKIDDAARVARVTALFAQNSRLVATIRAFLLSIPVRRELGFFAPLFAGNVMTS